MKHSLLFALTICFGMSCFAQKISTADVPPSVLKTYNMKMTDSVNTKWEKNDAYYTALFSKSKIKASMVINENAEWIWTRWTIPTQYLPKKVKEYVTTNYEKHKIKSAVVEYKPGGEFYIVKLKYKKEAPVLRFTIRTDFVGMESSK